MFASEIAAPVTHLTLVDAVVSFLYKLDLQRVYALCGLVGGHEAGVICVQTIARR